MQEAKEHLAALADKLGPSLTDIDVRTSFICSLFFVRYMYIFELLFRFSVICKVTSNPT